MNNIIEHERIEKELYDMMTIMITNKFINLIFQQDNACHILLRDARMNEVLTIKHIINET